VNPSLVAFELSGFLIGLFFGSFLNVCIVRVPRGESIVTPRSHCMGCGHLVRWWDNLPVLSWLVLRGKCRDCGARISWRYAAVELAVGLWFLRLGAILAPNEAVRQYHSYPLSTIILYVLGSATLGWLLIGLITIDWEWHRLPDAFTLGGIAIGMFLVCVQAIFLGPTDDQIVLNTTHQLRMSSPGALRLRET
jgi:leader peptidase (prepilin peptidase)/N-methyltransferase